MLDVKIVRGFTKESDTVSLSRKKPESPRSKKLAPKVNKKKNRKGGLSMF